MQVRCPKCRLELPVANVSFEAGLLKCDACNEVFPLSDILPVERPFDAWAKLERTERQLGIVVPPQGMRAATWGLLGFAAFWLAFIAFWTAGVLGFAPFGKMAAGAIPRAQVIFASFSIPFWLAGFGMLAGVIWSSRGSTSVYIDSGRAYLEKRCLTYLRRRCVSREKVQCARPGTVIVQQVTTKPVAWVTECARPEAVLVQRENGTYSPFSAELIYEGGSFKIPCNSQSEQDWIISEINGFLKSVPYSPADTDLLQFGGAA